MGRAMYGCVQGILITTNTLAALPGLLFIGFGAYVILFYSINPFLKYLSYCCFGIGSIIFLISIVGCCGSMFRARCLLITYAIIMFILAVAQSFLAVVFLDGTLNDQIDTYFGAAFYMQDATQYMLTCCGKSGPSLTSNPQSCCSESVLLSNGGTCTYALAYQNGCANALATFMNWPGYVNIGLAFVEFLSMVAAIYLCFRPMEPPRYHQVQVQSSEQHGYPAPAPSAPYLR